MSASDLPYYAEDGELDVWWVGEGLLEFPDSSRKERTDAGLFEIEQVNEDVLNRFDSGSALDFEEAMRDAEKTKRGIQAWPQMYRALNRIANLAAKGDVSRAELSRMAEEALPDLDVDVKEAYGWKPEPKRPDRRDMR